MMIPSLLPLPHLLVPILIRIIRNSVLSLVLRVYLIHISNCLPRNLEVLLYAPVER